MTAFRRKFDTVNGKLQALLGDDAVWLPTLEDGSSGLATNVSGLFSEDWPDANTAGYRPDITQPVYTTIAAKMSTAAEGDLLQFDGNEYVMQEPRPDGQGQLLIPLRHMRELPNE